MKKLLLFALAGLPIICTSQISKSEKQETIQEIIKVLDKRYVFPEVLEGMKSKILNNLNTQRYDTISSGKEFAFQLTQDLQQVSKDLHLSVQFEEKTQQKINREEKDNEKEWIERLLNENNYGIKSKKILDGNIGYLEIPFFGPLDLCADSLISAIYFIKDTEALILDLRSCRGSLDENAIPFFCSYFFNKPVHLFDFYTRETNSTKQFWTYAWVPGEKYIDKPIYILTSGRTFSGGEELAYDLKHLDRAKTIGEPTKGGANPTDYMQINSHFGISVPYMRSINPITKSNWEHSGVRPNIEVNSNIALHTAHVSALSLLCETEIDETRRINLNKTLSKVIASKPKFELIEFELKGFENADKVFIAGSFNSWSAKSTPLKKHGEFWSVQVECEPGKVSYQFVVDGRWITDPENPHEAIEGGYKRSVIFIE